MGITLADIFVTETFQLVCSVISTICVLCAPLIIWLIARGQRKSEKEAVLQALHEELTPLVGAMKAQARYQKCLADEAIKKNEEENDGRET